MSERAIGVFDSGLGGLTVLKELAHRFPQESFIYLGDTARLPYGSKSPETIRRYSEQNIKLLLDRDVKAVVIACNSASTQVMEHEWQGIPVYNVIEPGAALAVTKSASGRIGVLGTRATIGSGAYKNQIQKISSSAHVFSQACPLFVPLAEEGWDQDPITNLIVFRYLQSVMQNQIDVMILGCTHYPLLKNAISRVTGSSVELVDSGEAIAQWLEEDFQKNRLNRNTSGQKRRLDILTTDHSEHFNDLGAKILRPEKADSFQVVDL